MAQAAAIDIPDQPDEVWPLIGGFNSLPDWLGYIPKSELSEGGRVRHLANPNGETIVERLGRSKGQSNQRCRSCLRAKKRTSKNYQFV